MSQEAGLLRAVARRYGLSREVELKLSRLVELIASDPLAPTTVRRPGRVIDDHLADSLVALELECVRPATAVVDLGSGAGFPGLPLALALPDAAVVLLDGAARKTAFVERAIGVCEIGNARSVHGRAEAWREGNGRFDLVIARAVGALDVVAEYAAPLLASGGRLIVWRGRRDPAAEAAGERAAGILGLEVGEITPVAPYAGAEHRHLHVMRKVHPTPERFPRRPGMARKRPLGSPAPV